MKRLLALLLCLMMLAPAALAEDAAPSHEAVLTEWMGVAGAYEAICMTQDWALARAETYLETARWEDLLLARLAAGSAVVYLQHMVEIPQPALTGEDYVALLLEGQDYTFIPEEYKVLAQVLEGAILSMESLKDHLNHDVFWQYHDETVRAWVACRRELLHLDMQSVGVLTNAVGAAPGQEAALEAVKAAYAQACPTLSSAYAQWKTDSAALEADYAALLDQMEAQEQAFTAVLGMIDANGEMFRQIAAAGDISPLKADYVPIGGLPRLLPEPTWPMTGYPRTEYLWYSEETQEALYWMPGTEPKPYRLVSQTQWDQVSRADFDDYVTFLTEAGYSFVKDDAAEDARSLFYMDGTHTFVLDWTPEYVQLYSTDPAICQAPLWYVFAALEAEIE